MKLKVNLVKKMTNKYLREKIMIRFQFYTLSTLPEQGASDVPPGRRQYPAGPR